MDEKLFLTENAPDGGLFQSQGWARFQERNGRTVLPFSGKIFHGFALKETVPVFGDYLYIPRGPVLLRDAHDDEGLTHLLEERAKKEGVGWLRMEPQTEEALTLLRKNLAHKIVPAPHDIQPRETFMLSLDGDEEAWLARMKSKTRYNVRVAEKHGVTVRFSREEKDLEKFIALLMETARRQGIHLHPAEYYRNFLRSFSEEECVIAFAEVDGQVLAAALLVFYGETAYYLHGASSDERRECMAPYMLHFGVMSEAKRRGSLFYDLGGVRFRSKRDKTDTGWEGITRFKLNFAPNQETILFPGTYDILLNEQKYFLYTKARSLRHLASALRRRSP